MYMGTRLTPIIVMAIVIIVVVGGVLTYNYMVSQKPLTITTTVTATTTVTSYSTITIPAGEATTLTTTTTTTITKTVPLTVAETVTITSLPSQPPKTTTPTTQPPKVEGENFTVGNIQVYSTTTSIGAIGVETTKVFMLIKIPKDMSIDEVMNNLRQLVSEGMKITAGTVSVNVEQAYNPALVVILPRGTPCTMYKVVVSDGNASDGRMSLTVQKYSTADYCIQVVPPDNLYVGIIMLRNLVVGHYVIDVTMDLGNIRTQYTIDLVYG